MVTEIGQQDFDLTDFPYIAEVFDTMVGNATYSIQVDETLSFEGVSGGVFQQYWGPSYVAIERFTYNEQSNNYSDSQGQYSILISTSEPGEIDSCDTVLSDVTPSLALLTEDNVGTGLGILGQALCGLIGS